MTSPQLNEETLRRLLKEGVAEALEERRDLLHDVLAAVLEDFALAEAIREEQQSEEVGRDEVFAVLRAEGRLPQQFPARPQEDQGPAHAQ